MQRRQCVINEIEDFYEAVKGGKVQVTMITERVLAKLAYKLQLEQLFDNAEAITGITDFHFIAPGYVTKRLRHYLWLNNFCCLLVVAALLNLIFLVPFSSFHF